MDSCSPMISTVRISMDTKPTCIKKTKTHWFCYNSNYYKGMDTGDEHDEQEQKKTRDFMAKYMANYGAHRKGMSPEEVAEYYTRWSENTKYEQDLEPGVYNGPRIAAEAVGDVFRDWRDKIKVVDVACGSGLVGTELYKLGFRLLDGIDPSEGMLKLCRKKDIYQNLYQNFVNEERLPIEDGAYDCLVVSGGFGEGHVPCCALHEMVRIIRPGGSIILVMRKEYLKYVDEYTDRLEPLMQDLHRQGMWEMQEKKEVNGYSFDRQGLVFRFRVRKGLSDGDIEKARRLEKQREKERLLQQQQQQQEQEQQKS